MTISTDQFEKTHLSDLIPLVAFLVPQMDDGAIQYFLRLAAIKFARDSGCIRREIDIETYDKICDYYLELNDGYKIHRLIEVKHNDCCLCQSSGCHCHSGEFDYKQGKLVICGGTCAGDCLIAEVIAIPGLTSCYIDSEVVDNWFDGIIELFKSMVFGSNDKRWKNITESRNALQEYKRIASQAKAEYMLGNVSPKIVRLTW